MAAGHPACHALIDSHSRLLALRRSVPYAHRPGLPSYLATLRPAALRVRHARPTRAGRAVVRPRHRFVRPTLPNPPANPHQPSSADAPSPNLRPLTRIFAFNRSSIAQPHHFHRSTTQQKPNPKTLSTQSHAKRKMRNAPGYFGYWRHTHLGLTPLEGNEYSARDREWRFRDDSRR